MTPDVLVIGGGSSGHTRNLRCMHDALQDVLVDCVRELVQSGRWVGATLVCTVPTA